MNIVTALIAGLLFGAGLAVSGLMNPAKVQAFLDIAGTWDPTLLVVLAAASGITMLGYRLTARQARPWLGGEFNMPTVRAIDKKLIAGAGLFGLGWGLAGYCPGPAIAGLGFGNPKTWLFFVAMGLGMAAIGVINRHAARPA